MCIELTCGMLVGWTFLTQTIKNECTKLKNVGLSHIENHFLPTHKNTTTPQNDEVGKHNSKARINTKF